MPSSDHPRTDACRLSTPQRGAGDEARGLGSPGEEGRARFDSANSAEPGHWPNAPSHCCACS